MELENLKPWELHKDLIEILEEYDAKVVSDEKEYYGVEFYDHDGSVVECGILKKEFNVLPHKVGEGTNFFIVIYKYKNEKKCYFTTWPVSKFWHESWRD